MEKYRRSSDTCGICGSNDAWTTDQNYYCDNCGYNSPYSW